MTQYDDFAVCVTADWNDWRSANVQPSDLSDVHWHQPNGAPRPLVYAYLLCINIARGHLSHRCDCSSVPHRVRVCILKRHNLPAVYAQLVLKADEGLAASCLSSSAAVRSFVPLSVRR